MLCCASSGNAAAFWCLEYRGWSPFFRGPGETARSVCLAEVTTNNSSQEVRAATGAQGYITEKMISTWTHGSWNQFICCTCHATKNWFNQLHSWSKRQQRILSYQHCLLCYLKGESPHTGNFTVHYKYPFTVHTTFFFPFFQVKPQTSSLLTFYALSRSLSFFSERCVTILWFPYHSQCTGSVLSQNRSLSLFPLLSEDHSAKFTPNNKITGAQNMFLHIHRGLI